MTQRVIVTAAAGGIGRSIAAAFLTTGARVQICDVDEAAVRSFEDDFPAARAAAVDLAEPVSVGAWLDDAIADLGGVGVLVNNAGTKGPTAFVEDITMDEWRACLAVTLDSHFQCAARVAPLMKAQGSGAIINLSSMAGLVGYGMRSPYAAAKWAVIGLTKSLAIELGPHNVRCNCICPGSVTGDRMNRVATDEAESRGLPVDVVTAEYVAGQSIKRFVHPDEIAQLCLFLASPAASMITGQAIAIDGHSETYRL